MKITSPFSFWNFLESNNLVRSDKATLKTTARIPVDPCGNYGVNTHANLSIPRNNHPICRSVQHSLESSNQLQVPAFAKNNYSLHTTLLTKSVTFLSTL